MLAPGLGNQAREIGLGITQPARLLASVPAEFIQFMMRQVSPQGIRRDFIRSSSVRTRGFTHRAQQIVRDMNIVVRCHAALCFRIL